MNTIVIELEGKVGFLCASGGDSADVVSWDSGGGSFQVCVDCNVSANK